MAEYIPNPIGYAVSRDGDALTIYPGLDGIGEVGFCSEDGAGPYARVGGCPNCGKHAGWWSVIDLAGASNSGWNPNEPCSRVCRYQLEWAAELAARKATAPTANGG